jgi:hypothetical protein
MRRCVSQSPTAFIATIVDVIHHYYRLLVLFCSFAGVRFIVVFVIIITSFTSITTITSITSITSITIVSNALRIAIVQVCSWNPLIVSRSFSRSSTIKF